MILQATNWPKIATVIRNLKRSLIIVIRNKSDLKIIPKIWFMNDIHKIVRGKAERNHTLKVLVYENCCLEGQFGVSRSNYSHRNRKIAIPKD